jgi:CubicO group peptidase (beta-lactamase class C family)
MFHINKGKVSNNQLLCEDLLEEYHSIQFAEPDQKFGYALGLFRTDAIKPYGVMHAGGGFGFFSYMYINPGMKLGIILMTNAQARGLGMDSFRFADDIIIEKMNGKNFNKIPEWDNFLGEYESVYHGRRLFKTNGSP